jgi:hypothetical protein
MIRTEFTEKEGTEDFGLDKKNILAQTLIFDN